MKPTAIKENTGNAGRSLGEFIDDWKSLLESFPFPVCIVDMDYNVVSANREVYNLCGSIKDKFNTKYHKLFHNFSSPVENCPLVRCIESGKRSETRMYEPHLGKEVIIKTSPIIEGGSIIGVMLACIDVTKENNRELLEVYESAISEMKSRELRAQHGKDAFFNMLEDINESYEELEDLFMKLVRVMVNALDAKSPWTKGHSERVSMYSEAIALEMNIDQDDIKDIKLAGLLHDIGKIGTSDYLLDKPEALTKEEFLQIMKHPSQGAQILRDIKQLKDIIPYIEYHHEKIDGTGYPSHLGGEQIPMGARILHVADSFDSMTSDRPYRPAPGLEFALNELNTHKGTQFDPDVVDAFLKILSRSNNRKIN
jgi:putative nucleotidyltransferase with HDIG domain